jgi:DMSO reductase anchor subunit
MNQGYSIGVRFNHNFGFLETLSFVGEGIGAALYIFAFVTGQMLLLGVLSMAFVVGALVALGIHLGKPVRGWRAYTRFVTAWVSRGSIMMTGFLGFAFLTLCAGYLEFLAPFAKILSIVALVFSVGVLIYAGMALRSMRAIHLWRGPFVPLAFSAHSFATGATIVWALLPWLGIDAAAIAWLPSVGIGCLILAVALSGLHLALAERSAGVKASLARLSAGGDLNQKLTWGAGAVGIAAPLSGFLLSSFIAGSGAATLIGAIVVICRLYGDFAYRNAIVVAGAYEPLVPAAMMGRSAQAARA